MKILKKYKYLIILLILIIAVLITTFISKPINKGLTNKPKIAFCISGQVRTNSCVSDYDKDTYMEDSWNKYVFNEDLKNNYDYNVFISCDDKININKTKDYFGNHLKNIHIIDNDGNDTGYYLNEVKNKTPNLDLIINNDINNNNLNKMEFHNYCLQQYKIYDSLKLLQSYSNIHDYTYIIKLRFDNIIKNKFTDYINYLNNNKKLELYSHWDMIVIGRPKIMEHYFTLLPNYGKYNFTNQRHNMKYGLYGDSNKYYNIKNIISNIIAPEQQIAEHIYKYCNDNNLDIDETVKEIPLQYQCIVRENEYNCLKERCYQIKDTNIYCIYPPSSWKENKKNGISEITLDDIS